MMSHTPYERSPLEVKCGRSPISFLGQYGFSIARIIDHNVCVWMYMYSTHRLQFNWYAYNETFLVSRQGHNDSKHDCVYCIIQYCVIGLIGGYMLHVGHEKIHPTIISMAHHILTEQPVIMNIIQYGLQTTR